MQTVSLHTVPRKICFGPPKLEEWFPTHVRSALWLRDHPSTPAASEPMDGVVTRMFCGTQKKQITVVSSIYREIQESKNDLRM